MKSIHAAAAFVSLGLVTGLNASAQMTITNGASFNANQPLAPGSYGTIFGQNLCGQTSTGSVARGQYPTTLGGCSVSVNGTAAMLSYVSPGQINFIVPANMAPGSATVAVNSGSQTTNGSMNVGKAAPGVFSMNGTGVGDGAMLNGMTFKPGPFSTTTNGSPTAVSIFMTGLDLSQTPTVSVAGVPATVTFSGNAPGYPGLQQVNIQLPSMMAGAGRVPVTVTSDGVASNVTYMTMLPTTAMMQGMPGFSSGMTVAENTARDGEVSYMTFNPTNGTALVTDQNDDSVRVISPASGATTATIPLPAGSQAHGVAVGSTGKMAAVTLSGKSSVALIDLTQNKVTAVIGTGDYPSCAAFSGTNVLVTNQASGTMSVIDAVGGTVVKTVQVGFGPNGIATANNMAVVANMQVGSVSLVNLGDYSVTTLALPAGARPYEVAVSGNQAVITNPPSNGVFLMNLGSRQVTPVDLGAANVMGPGAVAINGNSAYISNMMSSSVTVLDMSSGRVINTISVDPGPRALAMDTANNRMLVLAEGTGTLDMVDLGSMTMMNRMNAVGTTSTGTFTLPTVSSLSPNSGAAGSTITLTITGTGLQSVRSIDFATAGSGGMMGGGMGMGAGFGSAGADPNIKVTNIQVNAAGTQLTATVQILAAAAAGPRQVRIHTDTGAMMMGTGSSAVFTVTR